MVQVIQPLSQDGDLEETLYQDLNLWRGDLRRVSGITEGCGMCRMANFLIR